MIEHRHCIFASVVILTFSARVVHAYPPTRMVTRTQVNRACDSASKFAEANPGEGFTFWDVTAGLIPASGAGVWWRIDDVRRWAVVDPLGAHGPNTQVSAWKTPDKVLLVASFFTSDSGDWAYFVDYCYRPDGTLARTSSTLNSFVAGDVPGGIRRERTRYFDTKGKAPAPPSTVSSLDSGKVLRIQVPGYDEPDYITVEKLPFHPLLTSGLSARERT